MVEDPGWFRRLATDYLGKTYPPTQHVDVFFSPQDVKRPYEVMGEISAEADDIVSYESMQQKLMQEAMQKGVDATLIEKLDTTETGYTTVENKSASLADFLQADMYVTAEGPLCQGLPAPNERPFFVG